MKFGEKLKEARTAAGLTQIELAQKVGMSKRTIVGYESGQFYPRNRELYGKLAEALGVSEAYLKTEEEEFITEAGEQYGRRGEIQAQQVRSMVKELFAGGTLSDEDKQAFLMDIQELYFDSKRRAKKFTPKKYLNDSGSETTGK